MKVVLIFKSLPRVESKLIWMLPLEEVAKGKIAGVTIEWLSNMSMRVQRARDNFVQMQFRLEASITNSKKNEDIYAKPQFDIEAMRCPVFDYKRWKKDLKFVLSDMSVHSKIWKHYLLKSIQGDARKMVKASVDILLYIIYYYEKMWEVIDIF